jgi:predicted transcriptional regulator
MKTITLKTDDSFFDKVTMLAKQLHLSKSELIRRSISEYELIVQKQKLKEQMTKASQRVREESLKSIQNFESTLGDGLENV